MDSAQIINSGLGLCTSVSGVQFTPAQSAVVMPTQSYIHQSVTGIWQNMWSMEQQQMREGGPWPGRSYASNSGMGVVHSER